MKTTFANVSGNGADTKSPGAGGITRDPFNGLGNGTEVSPGSGGGINREGIPWGVSP